MEVNKKFLSFDELAERWKCNKRDIHYFVGEGGLTPSIVWDRMLIRKWEPWSDEDGESLILMRVFDQQTNRPIIRSVKGWVFLFRPTVTGPYRYSFEYATKNPYPKDEEGEEVYQLVDEFGYSYEVENEWIENNAVFMREIVDDYETIFEPSLANRENLKSEISGYNALAAWESTGRAHVSNRLAFLQQAALKFWANADKTDRTTHPKSRVVVAWLMEHGFSAKLAESAATIIRPDWAPVGRPPEE